MKRFQDWKSASPNNSVNDNMLLIGMSASATERDQQEAFGFGMHLFASKPVNIQFLSNVLEMKSKKQNLPYTVRQIKTGMMMSLLTSNDFDHDQQLSVCDGDDSVLREDKQRHSAKQQIFTNSKSNKISSSENKVPNIAVTSSACNGATSGAAASLSAESTDRKASFRETIMSRVLRCFIGSFPFIRSRSDSEVGPPSPKVYPSARQHRFYSS